MGCSALNSHLCLLLHVKPSPDCVCGASIESPKHYFLQCPRYTGIRNELKTEITNVTDCNISTILFGDPDLS